MPGYSHSSSIRSFRALPGGPFPPRVGGACPGEHSQAGARAPLLAGGRFLGLAGRAVAQPLRRPPGPGQGTRHGCLRGGMGPAGAAPSPTGGAFLKSHLNSRPQRLAVRTLMCGPMTWQGLAVLKSHCPLSPPYGSPGLSSGPNATMIPVAESTPAVCPPFRRSRLAARRGQAGRPLRA